MAKTTGPKKSPAKDENIETMSKIVTVDGQELIQLTKEDFESVRAHIETVQQEKKAAEKELKALRDTAAKSSDSLEDLKKEKDEAISIAQRLSADFDNYRKRNAALRTDSMEEGKRDCIKALLPVLDNFDRALGSVAGVDPSFVAGIELIYRNMLDILKGMGLAEIEADGAFDANLHYAVMREAVEGKSAGDILEVLQKGYRVQDKILRYTMVKVAE